MSKAEIEKMNQEQETMQDRVRKDVKDCDHIGFYTPLGHAAFPIEQVMVVTTSVLCMMCGKQWHGISELRNQDS